MKDITLSIYVATFNHEKYIEQALDSILMQKTNYTYEVLVGEDASTDNTRNILEKYEKKHPGILQVYYREKNMHREKINNICDLVTRCKGKYMIALEGDDFWIDCNKLEEQINFLEENPEYIAVAHNCQVVDENSKLKNEKYPECEDEIYTIEHYASGILPGQLATVMKRNFRRDNIMDTSIVDKGLVPGDRAQYFALLCNGKIRCIQKKMSCYRHVTDFGSSFSATTSYNYNDYEKLYLETIEYAKKMENKKYVKYMEFAYLKNIWTGLKTKQISKGQAKDYIKNIQHKFFACYLYIKFWVNYHIFHKSKCL